MRKHFAVLAVAASSILAAGVASADTRVNGYTRSDGTSVSGYTRSDSNSTQRDNYSSSGNTNPYTGQQGTRTPRY